MTKATLYLPIEMKPESIDMACEKTNLFFDRLAVQIAPQGKEPPEFNYLVDLAKDSIKNNDRGSMWVLSIYPVRPTCFHAMQTKGEGIDYIRIQKDRPIIDITIGDTYYMFSQEPTIRHMLEDMVTTREINLS